MNNSRKKYNVVIYAFYTMGDLITVLNAVTLLPRHICYVTIITLQ